MEFSYRLEVPLEPDALTTPAIPSSATSLGCSSGCICGYLVGAAFGSNPSVDRIGAMLPSDIKRFLIGSLTAR